MPGVVRARRRAYRAPPRPARNAASRSLADRDWRTGCMVPATQRWVPVPRSPSGPLHGPRLQEGRSVMLVSPHRGSDGRLWDSKRFKCLAAMPPAKQAFEAGRFFTEGPIGRKTCIRSTVCSHNNLDLAQGQFQGDPFRKFRRQDSISQSKSPSHFTIWAKSPLEIENEDSRCQTLQLGRGGQLVFWP